MRWLLLVVPLTMLPLTNNTAVPQEMATHPDCSGAGRWATTMALVHLTNEAVTNNARIDSTKTTVVRLASEQIGKDLFRQVHDVKFTETSGDVIEVITVNDASHRECSESGVDVFVVAKHLGGR